MDRRHARNPDPGNSPPEDWSETMTEEEQAEVRDRLARESEEE